MEKTDGKGENASNQHFLLFPAVFSTLSKREIGILSTSKIVVYKLYQYGRV